MQSHHQQHSNFWFVVAVSEHFRAGSEALPFQNTFIKCTYHFENIGTVVEGIEEEK